MSFRIDPMPDRESDAGPPDDFSCLFCGETPNHPWWNDDFCTEECAIDYEKEVSI
jgi:hypothetical protein